MTIYGPCRRCKAMVKIRLYHDPETDARYSIKYNDDEIADEHVCHWDNSISHNSPSINTVETNGSNETKETT
jgi:hypothetical protein